MSTTTTTMDAGPHSGTANGTGAGGVTGSGPGSGSSVPCPVGEPGTGRDSRGVAARARIERELLEARQRYTVGRLIMTAYDSPEWEIWWGALEPDEQMQAAKAFAILVKRAALDKEGADGEAAEEYVRAILGEWIAAMIPASLYTEDP
ncbi:hypothetical protein [Streptomyces sp. SP18CS02]|uniref:hypothetical protein n=1 Tax=Streptomyces sp. SP18CS02 TaxID=3002531 RepID=UPI002E78CB0A|nr:hypothetical protein [Streptomyces sp. SP18CS02]MEE1757467.1 hypothetical protein [Streptomyces sp. SP18CS02]